MRFVLLICGLLSTPFFLSAQEDYSNKNNAKGKTRKQYDRVLTFVQYGSYDQALSVLEQITKNDPRFIDAYIMRGDILYDRKQYDLAESQFEKALEIDPEYQSLVLYKVGFAEWRQDKFDEAGDHLAAYLETNPKSTRQREIATEMLEGSRFAAEAMRNPVPFEPQRMSPNVNSEEAEYLPAITADGQTLIFTRVVNNQEDFYQSFWTTDGWSPAVPLEQINTPLNEGGQTISADGRFLIFTACNRREGEGRCDLFYAEKINGNWSAVKPLPRPVNTGAWESQPSISANRTELFFASDRGGGLGKKDIWVSTRLANGKWAVPVNVGPNINTGGNDKAPFIHPDGKTLYFMSDGHPGMGGFDLYRAQRQADGSWGKAENLGFPINSTKDEGALMVSLDGETAYFASDRDDLDRLDPNAENRPLIPSYDLFTFPLYEAMRPEAVTYVRATVVEKGTGKPLQVDVSIREVDFAEAQPLTFATDNEGTFLTTLPVGQNYALNVQKTGYLFYSDYFALAEASTFSGKPYELLIELIPVPEDLGGELEAEQPIVLKNVFFNSGSAELKPSSEPELNLLYQTLVDNPKLRIELRGHTDNVGSDTDNQLLSENRAQAVYQYLVDRGIDSGRLQFQGFGETQPVDTNETANGRRNNRRTEFVILL